MADIKMPMRPSDNQIEAALSFLPDMNPGEARRALKGIYRAFIELRPETEIPKTLTKKMAQLLEIIEDFITDNGYAPTQQELADMLGVDRKTVRQRLTSLRNKRFVTWTGKNRAITLIKQK